MAPRLPLIKLRAEVYFFGKGDKEPVVINLGQDTTVTKLSDGAKAVSVLEHRKVQQKKDIIKHPALLNDFFQDLINQMPDIKNEKIIITLSYGSGIQYRTSTVSANDIIIDDRKLKPEEKENLVLDKCRAFLPPGLSSIAQNWEVCVMDAYVGDIDVIVSCCYLPTDYLDNIKIIAETLDLDVVMVTSHAYGLYKILNSQDRQLLLEIPTGWLAINEFGLACWPRPQNCQMTEEQIINDLSLTTERLFKIDAQKMNEVVNNVALDIYLKKPIEYAGKFDPFIVAAAGCVINKLPKTVSAAETEEQKKKGGMLDEITGKLRQLFAKKGQ